ALDRVAKFYLDMAENMFPVIEVDAARKIEVIVTRGASLSLVTSQGVGARR
ncbi:conjugal transfer protein TraB, partial [Escherichia coli]|nr:conjugal transfer protein TraB [Escherichia coli]